MAVAESDARFEVHALTSPPWGTHRYAICTADRTFCTAHLSSSSIYDDRQKGALPAVGAEYWVSSRDLRVLVEEATEPVLSGDLDVGVDWIG
ncbi:hypothetical protein B0I32_108300 [Nonomuraea fuscirosea]|uniref:Uncharacterized protein n=1 Tax=Nonomuraea fuscirosea TaxID=1291556 RepID=A0A2T0N008_9ACTN|nr:hypothetical protein B0I32_108300 [Nonomuraea fuscirosea]